LATGLNDDRALLNPSVALLHPTDSLLRPGDESLHPSDIRPPDVRAAFQGSAEARSADLGIDPAALANIRIPAQSEPPDGEVPTRLVLSDDDRARSDTEEMLTAGLPANLASAAGAAGGERASLGLHGGAVVPGDADDDWSRRIAQALGMLGLSFFVAGSMVRHRRLAGERSYLERQAARPRAPLTL